MRMYYISNLLRRFDNLRVNPIENKNKLEQLHLEVKSIISTKEKNKDNKYFIETLEFISNEIFFIINEDIKRGYNG